MQWHDFFAYVQEEWQIEVSKKAWDKMDIVARELQFWNQSRVNLTAITEIEDIIVRHFLDSISILANVEIPEGAKLIDVGTGAGFPGIVLKIARPDIQLTLVESFGKKAEYLRHAVTQLGWIDEVEVLQERAEDVGQDEAHREAYDVVVARGVANMPTLAEYLVPLAKIGGLVIAQKGDTAEAEVEDGRFSIEKLGGAVQKIVPVQLPTVEQVHHLVLIDKVSATPDNYPRRAGMPTKRPLHPKS